MIVSEISVKRPVLATVVSLLIVVLGIASLTQLPVREYPDIDPPVVSVTTEYIGAGPEVMNNEITEVLESAISGVDGIRNITSESREGRAETTIEFNLSRDIDNAANDVRDAINRVGANLPTDADPPVVTKTEADARPMMWLAMTSDRLTAAEMTDLAERQLVDRLSVLEGVSQIRIGGERRYAMRLWLNREAMAARGVTVEDIENTLRRNNLELPAGQVESVTRTLNVRADSRLNTPDEFERLVIRREGDVPIRIGDIASVMRGVEDDRAILRNNGRNAIGLGIIRQSQANIIEVSDLVRTELDAIRPSLPEGVEIAEAYNQSVFISESIKEVLITLSIAVGLVVLVIFIFLRSVRATLVPAVTIPVAVIGAFSVMAPLGFSVNVLTLLALVLAIGLVVDDAIVMLENIQRRVDEGEPRLLAAYRGSKQVGFAIVATTVTLIAVFVPIAFMEGNVGRLFTEFGFVLAAAVAFSSIVALTLAPMLCSKWLRPVSSSRGLVGATEVFFVKLTAGYRWLLVRALGMPVVIIAGAVVVALVAVKLGQMLPEELSPTEDRGVFIIPSSAPQGSTAEYTDRNVRLIEEIVNPLLESGDATRVFSIVGFRDRFDSAFTIVGLAPWSERDRRQQDMVAEVFPQIASIPGIRAFAVNPPGLGQSGFQQPVQFVIGGPDYETVEEWGERVLARAQENSQLLNADLDYEETRPQLNVRIDRELAADLDIPVEAIGRTLQTMLASRTVTTYLDRGREYDVRLQASRQERSSPSDLEEIFVRSGNNGQLVPLSSLITLEESGAAPVLSRVDRLPSVTLTASLAPGYDLGSALRFLESAASDELPDEARISYLGQSQEFMSTSGAIYFTFALALLVVFLVLSAQFESFVHPAIILLSVPLAITGALLALFLTGITLNVYSQIGMILLIGLMAKNGILIVEFANQLRDEGYNVLDAITEGAVLRFRPILMTAVSTVFGALPLVLASGAGAESRASIGVVVIGGLALATVLTLFLTPVLYNLLARFTRSAGAVAADLEQLASEERASGRRDRGPQTESPQAG
ncbi:multidrug efflux pump [Natronocella acetinitrilica]|uniref:Multidrug efflux pump n=1 Tax=Natronocella acetinitrilica TaxID=414046 RepID=A0AAE3KCL3_9GAMM|nr:efflux RND transporter permease subunit [Natronocella acetinitrilica]MCP1677030.1 multidrug efflux pump [Natronocella acetinitrilica]